MQLSFVKIQLCVRPSVNVALRSILSAAGRSESPGSRFYESGPVRYSDEFSLEHITDKLSQEEVIQVNQAGALELIGMHLRTARRR